MITEADTCRKYVLPKLEKAGWETPPHSLTEQKTFTDGRPLAFSTKKKRLPQKRADYLLRYHNHKIAVVEAKSAYKLPGDGLQQAKEYAEILDLKFAYSTNGQGIIEFDFITGKESELDAFPTPEELWRRYSQAEKIEDKATVERLLTPAYYVPGMSLRYYQEIAINRTFQAILQGRHKVLLTMATGTGKTLVAFQICWKLWKAKWNRTGEHRPPRILYLADRNVLVDDPKDKMFTPFEDARWKIENGVANQGRQIYFATYQAIAEDKKRPGLYKEYAPDFFDLVIVDECHRGSADDEGKWRRILEYFRPAFQLGMTATPKRADNVDTYNYFGNPIYQYSLKQGIEDGFLAPYLVHRIITSYDAEGWKPEEGQLDRYGRKIPKVEYHTKEIHRDLSLHAHTEAIARHLTDFLKRTDRFAKTIVFCADQEKADDMRRALSNLNLDLVKNYPNYVARVTSDEGRRGRALLSRFQEPESKTPVILTTSQLLTTGVDAPTCKNIVIARVVDSMIEFKQIIGRGTRLRADYDKLFFNILDYTGSATRKFADKDFDGFPASITEVNIDEKGEQIEGTAKEEIIEEPAEDSVSAQATGQASITDDSEGERRKYYVDGGHVEIVAHLVYDYDTDGNVLRVIEITDYTAEQINKLYPSAIRFRKDWSKPEQRAEIIEHLAARGISFEELAEAVNDPEADPFDLLCHVAFNAPLRTRRERADRVRRDKKDFFEQYGAQARQILHELLEKYAEHGAAQFVLPDVLQIPPISAHGNVMEIAELFGGAKKLKEAVHKLQTLLYAA
ncbi:MAG TPA: DEAD/DEAH box helicase family protein [Pyrinomonadaceae bacterium]|jgi:type I restriction enzyme R subunit